MPSQWETSLPSNDVSHCLGSNLESALGSGGGYEWQAWQPIINFPWAAGRSARHSLNTTTGNLACRQSRWWVSTHYLKQMASVLHHNIFPLAMSSLNNVYWLISYNKQMLVGCIAIFYKYCCYTKCGDIIKKKFYEIIGVYYWCVKIPQCVYMKHGLKYNTLYVEKHIASLTMCYNPPLVHHKLLGAPAFVKLAYFILLLLPFLVVSHYEFCHFLYLFWITDWDCLFHVSVLWDEWRPYLNMSVCEWYGFR